MYGPDEITKRPYSPGLPLKHLATSCGIGPAAGMPRRCGKSPVGFVRLNTIVLAFGVLMPEIDLRLALAVRLEALDHVEVERVLPAVLRVRETVERVLDVARGDLRG